MRIAAIFLLGLLVCSYAAFAQLPDDTRPKPEQAESLFKEGDTLDQDASRVSKQAAIAAFGKALAIFREIGTKQREGETLHRIGRAYSDINDEKKALEIYLEALAIRREARDRIGEARTLNNIGVVYKALEERERAIEYFSQALAIYKETGSKDLEASTLNNIGTIYDDLRDKEKAIEYYNLALGVAEEAGSGGQQAQTLLNIGAIYDDREENEKALEYYERAIPLAQRAGSRGEEARALNLIGTIHDELGDAAKAIDHYRRSLAIYRDNGDRDNEIQELLNIGELLNRGNGDLDLTELKQALEIAKTEGLREREAETLSSIGLAFSRRNQVRQAIEKYHESAEIYAGLDDVGSQADQLENVGWEYLAINQYGLAEEYLLKAIKLWEGVRDPRRGGAHMKLADVFRYTNKPDEGLAQLDAAYQIYRDAKDVNHAADALTRSGRQYRDRGELNAALEKLNLALPLRKEGGDAEKISDIYNEIGMVERALGNTDAARKSFANALAYLMRGPDGKLLGFTSARERINIALANTDRAAAAYKDGDSLKSGTRLSREVKAEDWTHEYPVKLEKGEVLHIVFDQHGVDVVSTLLDRSGKEHIKADRNIGEEGVESLLFIAPAGGRYVLRVRPLEKTVGTYDIWVEALRKPSDADRKRVEAERSWNEFSTLWGAIEDKRKAAFEKDGSSDRSRFQADALTAEKHLLNAYHRWSEIPDIAEMQTALWALYRVKESYRTDPRELQKYYRELVLVTRVSNDPTSELNLLRPYANWSSVQWDKEAAIGVGNDMAFITHPQFGVRQISTSENYSIALRFTASIYSNSGKKNVALEFYKKAHAVDVGADYQKQARSQEEIGRSISTYDIPLAIEYFEKAAALYARSGDTAEEGEMYANICGHLAGDDPKRTIHYCEKAITKRSKDANGGGFEEWHIGNSLAALGKYKDALAVYERGLRSIKKRLDWYDYENSILQGLGRVYRELGNRDRSVEYLEKAKAGFIRDKDVSSSFSQVLRELGDIYAEGGDWKKAIANYNEALAKRRFDNTLLANLSLEEAELTSKIAYAQLRSGDQGSAQASIAEAEEILKNEKRPSAEVARVSATIFAAQGKKDAAVDRYHKALAIYKEQSNRYGEASVLTELMTAFFAQSNERLGIFYGKQAVNVYQAIRGNIADLEKDVRSGYLRSKEQVYRDLANALTDQGRLAEAQQILDLLKEEEYYEFVRRDASEAKELADVSMTDREKTALAEYARLADQLSAIGKKYQALFEKRSKIGGKLEESEEAEFQKTKSEMDTANEGMKVFLKNLESEFTKQVEEKNVITPPSIERLQAGLRTSGNNAVLLTTYLLPKRYRVIVTTGRTMVDRKVEYADLGLNEEQVKAKITEFTKILRQPRIDPRPLGKELYDIFVKPIEKDIERSGAKTLLWSLDGRLRYVPMAALSPDGKSYLAERYENAVFTISRTDDAFGKQNGSGWQALGAGVSQAHPGFEALGAVPAELRTIIRSDESEANGVLTGKYILDRSFTQKSFIDELGKRAEDEEPIYKVVHIATHFKLGANNADSYLLLGDGTHLSLDTIGTDSGFDFAGVDLLTLSACQTGLSVGEGNGREVEGLGLIAQAKGARSVLASLWPVADESTQLLMTEFYKLKKGDPAMTKSAALQSAQKAMIAGRLKGTGNGTCRAEVNEKGAPAEFKCDTNAPYSHPYFWAPFVLIGNWR